MYKKAQSCPKYSSETSFDTMLKSRVSITRKELNGKGFNPLSTHVFIS
jgi:hypothetical protein